MKMGVPVMSSLCTVYVYVLCGCAVIEVEPEPVVLFFAGLHTASPQAPMEKQNHRCGRFTPQTSGLCQLQEQGW